MNYFRHAFFWCCVGLGIGLASQPAVERIRANRHRTRTATTAAEHWKVVNDCVSLVKGGKSPEFDCEASLVALHVMGELEQMFVFLPTVPDCAWSVKYLLQETVNTPGIIYWVESSNWNDVGPDGKKFLAFKIWFRKSAKQNVDRIIRELEAMAAKEREQKKVR